MEYDPIKDILAVPMRHNDIVRRGAYRAFELGFLRVRWVKRELGRLLRARHGRETRILDVGFGFGPYSDYALRHFPEAEVVGIEVKDEQVEDCNRYIARQGMGERASFHVQDALDLNALDSYDLAIAVDILEHIEDDVRVLTNIRRALRERGRLLIHTPASDVDSRTVNHEHFFVGEHVRDGYLPDELREKLQHAGFEKVRVKRTYGPWGMRAWWLMQGIPFRLLDRSPLFAVLLPVYYALVFPFAHRFMLADLAEEDRTDGKGLLVVATA